jgi:hypothetical protein
MDQTFGVEIGERVEGGSEQVTSLPRRKRPLGKNLRQNFIGKLSDDIQARDIVNLATAVRIDLHQVGMGESFSRGPGNLAGLGGLGICRNEFDDGLLPRLTQLGKKDASVLAAAKPSKQGEPVTGEAPDPLAADCRCIHGFDHTTRPQETS